jgi:hypothetical protein
MATQRRRSTKGTRSKTHKGRKNYTTKKGDKVFHRKGKYVRKSRKPYSKKKRGGFGFVDLAGKLGIERRIYTSDHPFNYGNAHETSGDPID